MQLTPKKRVFPLLCWAALSAGPVVEPNSSAIHYMGRFDFRDPRMPRFSWPMAGLSVTFQGSQTVFGNFSFPASGGRLRVVVDGKTHGFLQRSSGCSMQQFKLADGLDANQEHALEIYKANEQGIMSFGGFQLQADAWLLANFPKTSHSSRRKLEFIGDSDTAGWCADGDANTGDDENTFEDAYVTWAQQLARALNAESMVEAISGWGVSTASHPIQEVLDLTLQFDNASSWDYSTWTPNAVVILIGPNDENRLDGSSFVRAYKNLLEKVAYNYKHADIAPKIVHVCGGSINGLDPCADIFKANEEFNREQKHKLSGIKGYYTSITSSDWKMINGPDGKGTSLYNGCDRHYSEKGHRVLAGAVLPQMRKIMGWDQLDSTETDLLFT